MISRNYQNASEVTKFLLLIVVLICVMQVGVLWIPEGVVYRTSNYVSSDTLLMLLSLVAYRKTPHRDIAEKACWSGVFIWHFGCWIYNIVVQMFFINTTVAVMSVTAMMFVFMIIFAFRYSFKWSTFHNPHIKPGSFYLIINKPKNTSQLGVAVCTGDGGSFAITDGVLVWRYSKTKNSMICEPIKQSHSIGAMVHRLCDTSEKKYDEIDKMIGQVFTLMHNCIEIRTLASRWSNAKY